MKVKAVNEATVKENQNTQHSFRVFNLAFQQVKKLTLLSTQIQKVFALFSGALKKITIPAH